MEETRVRDRSEVLVYGKKPGRWNNRSDTDGVPDDYGKSCPIGGPANCASDLHLLAVSAIGRPPSVNNCPVWMGRNAEPFNLSLTRRRP